MRISHCGYGLRSKRRIAFRQTVGAWPFKNDDAEADAGASARDGLQFAVLACGASCYAASDWAAAHQQELLANWELMRNDQPPNPIDPLD
jgi:hypothetical protein